MSIFSGKVFKGAMGQHKEMLHEEAVARNALTPDDRRKKNRLKVKTKRKAPDA